jgi:hypothetical protein
MGFSPLGQIGAVFLGKPRPDDMFIELIKVVLCSGRFRKVLVHETLIERNGAE